MGSNLDLRKWQDPAAIQDAYSRVVSGGRTSYKAVIERKKDLPKCPDPHCAKTLEGTEKFCSECGTKIILQSPAAPYLVPSQNE